MITQIDENLWIKNSHFTVMGCNGSTRMVLVRTGDGILIYSPVDLDDDDVAAIKALGKVVAIIAPNIMHHMYFNACHARFPDAKCWIAKSLAEKVKVLPQHEVLRADCPIAPEQELSHFVIDGHKLNETMLFHHPSGTLITADLLYNYQAQQFTGEKLLFRLIGCYGKPAVPFYHRRAMTDRATLAASLESIFRLPIRRIIMAHGEIAEGEDMAQVFAQAWDRLLGKSAHAVEERRGGTQKTYLNEAKALYTKHRKSVGGQPTGCNEPEVRLSEEKFGRSFPAAFREYLLWMGNDKMGVLRGSERFLSNLESNTEALPDLLAERGLSLDETIQPVCFFMHQGYIASWFDLNTTADDPPCFAFSEAASPSVITGPILFSSFLKADLEAAFS